MKPIVRWTIGNVSSIGWDALKISVNNARKIWGDRVDYVVTYNGLPESYSRIKDVSATFIKVAVSDSVFGEFGGQAPGQQKSGWVFCPLQVDTRRKQITFDNDVILVKSNALLDEFLFGCVEFLFNEHWVYDDKPKRTRRNYCFKRLSDWVPNHVKRLNAQMGLPGFDCAELLLEAVRELPYHDVLRDGVGWSQALVSVFYERIKDKFAVDCFSYRVIPVYPRKTYRVFDESIGVHLSGINQLSQGWTVKKFKSFVREWVL